MISADNKGRAGKQTQTKNNAWFVGFAPRRNPEIVVAVLVQAGGFGAVSSAPIARDIVKAYYDKKQGKLPEQLHRTPGSRRWPTAAAPQLACAAARAVASTRSRQQAAAPHQQQACAPAAAGRCKASALTPTP